MKDLQLITNRGYIGNRTIVNINISSVSELKAKVIAFTELFGSTPELYVYIDNDCFVHVQNDSVLGVYEGYAYNHQVSECSTLSLGSKYMQFDNGNKYKITSSVEVGLYKTI
jgi:hypothetical protein